MIVDIRHPKYEENSSDWSKYRSVYKGGRSFINKYLEKFSERESDSDFLQRQKITYNPAHVKAAIQEIRDSIFSRLVDVSRTGGPDSYTNAVLRDIDHNGNSMNSFLGRLVLPDLLTIGSIGVYVDKDPIDSMNPTRAETNKSQPYLYTYPVESILSWSFGQDNKLDTLLLRDNIELVDEEYGLTNDYLEQFRYFQRTLEGIIVTIYDAESKILGTYTLNIPEIPFAWFTLSTSLLVDAADYQIALLNLASSDMNYSLKSNYPFYTEQYSPGFEFNKEDSNDIEVGVAQGRRYPKGLNQPAFINPSPEPLRVSMEKQKMLIEEIRQIINLSLATIQPNPSVIKSNQQDTSGRERGLANIGRELEFGERAIARLWLMYESASSDRLTIHYPHNYMIRTDSDRRDEANALLAIGPTLPSKTFQVAIAKEVVDVLLGSKISDDELQQAKKEIEQAKVIFVDPETLRSDAEAGFVGIQTASESRGYPKGEVEQAKIDHAERVSRIAIAQSDASSRGVSDLSNDPAGSAAEKAGSQDTSMSDTSTPRTRGNA